MNNKEQPLYYSCSLQIKAKPPDSVKQVFLWRAREVKGIQVQSPRTWLDIMLYEPALGRLVIIGLNTAHIQHMQ